MCCSGLFWLHSPLSLYTHNCIQYEHCIKPGSDFWHWDYLWLDNWQCGTQWFHVGVQQARLYLDTVHMTKYHGLLYVSTPWDLSNQGHFIHICIVRKLMWIGLVLVDQFVRHMHVWKSKHPKGMLGAVCLLASQLVSTFSSRVKDIYTLQRLKGTAQPPPCDSKKSNYLQP